MNRHFVMSVVAVFVATLLLGMLIHGIVLGPEYEKLTPNFYRPHEDAQRLMGFMLLGNLMFAAGFTWIYRQGREAKPWVAQGARFGAAVAIMTTIPTYLTYYVVQPTPSHVVMVQIIGAAISLPLVGILCAALNRDPPRA
jgi:Kef-type K+ transport system membrane component KefB